VYLSILLSFTSFTKINPPSLLNRLSVCHTRAPLYSSVCVPTNFPFLYTLYTAVLYIVPYLSVSHHSNACPSGRLRSIHAVVPAIKQSTSEKGYTLITPVPTGAQTLCGADSQASIITPHSHNCTTTYVLLLSFSCHN